MFSILNVVQIICMVLTFLMALTLGIFLPRYTKPEEITRNARKYLVASAVLIVAHYLAQLILHKYLHVTPEMRTVTNMLFGFPVSYLTNISLLVLQRRNKLSRSTYLAAPVLFVIALTLAALNLTIDAWPISLRNTTVCMSALYAASLAYYHVLQVKEYLHIRSRVKEEKDYSLEAINAWTRWSILLLILVNIGLPIMTFNTNPTARSVYGIYSILVVFFYEFSFIIYNLRYFSNISLEKVYLKAKASSGNKAERLKTEEARTQRTIESVQKWIESQQYLQAGITMKDVVTQMGISRNMLNEWLQTTEQKQFNSWLMYLRIEEAKKQMLKHSDWSNETIAKACGFSDRSYFQRQFREVVGTSPAKWIKSQTLQSTASTPEE